MKNKTNVFSEIGKLNTVILHTPGKEVENMNPNNAERALYSDILNLSVAIEEYKQLKGVLSKYANVLEVEELLESILKNEKIKSDLIQKICKNEFALDIQDDLIALPPNALAKSLIEGVELKKNNLTNYLSVEKYKLRPLHNFFFTRDASISVGNKALIGKMKSNVRERESIIMEAIFDYSPIFDTKTMNPNNYKNRDNITIEGGDVLVVKDDILCIGIGTRTNTQGVDFILNQLKNYKDHFHVVVQELPSKPESFIHLDMVFTMLDKDMCMVYEPLLLKANKYQTLHIEVNQGKVKITEKNNILQALKELGLDLKPVLCGGNNDIYVQEREQWHSGANFFALAPGKIIGYGRNVYSAEALNKVGFEIIHATEIISGKKCMNDYEKAVITIDGSELSRGGGGCRCMTMPVNRDAVEW